MLKDPNPSQQHEGLHHAVRQLQQEVTRPKARFKPNSPEKLSCMISFNQSECVILCYAKFVYEN